MENAMKQYPASAEKVLKKEARNVAKDLKAESIQRQKDTITEVLRVRWQTASGKAKL